jgi:transposase
MPRRIYLHPHLTDHDLHERYRHAHNSVERSRWQFLWLLARGLTATAIAHVTGYSAYWIGQIARRYNLAGADAVRDQRRPGRARQPLLTAEHQATLPTALATALAIAHPAGDHWCGRTVATWMSTHLGRHVSRQAGWRVLRQIGARFLTPRAGRPRGAGLLQGTSSPAPA